MRGVHAPGLMMQLLHLSSTGGLSRWSPVETYGAERQRTQMHALQKGVIVVMHVLTGSKETISHDVGYHSLLLHLRQLGALGHPEEI